MTVKALLSSTGRACAAAALLFASYPALADIEPNAGMMRYPDVSKTHIVFVYAGDLWLVPRAGGVATRLASPPGQELFPKFSPDDKTIAFIGNYDGNRDIYSIPVDGGTAQRITHHPGGETLCDWSPEGNLIFSTSGLGGLRRQNQLMTVPATGGMPTSLPVPYGANGAISPDGTWLAYTPHSVDNRTWKRYRGGMATDIWLFNLKDKTSKKITDWEGTDSIPMWFKDKVYYLSDMGSGGDGYEGDHRLNIWVYNTATGKRSQVTKFKDFDVKWPSMGPGRGGRGEIVFQNGSSLYLLDLDDEEPKPRAVSVTIPGDRPNIRERQVDVEKSISGWSLSPSAKRAAVESRGDIWSLPAEKGTPRNLTRSDTSAERDPSWSPDGRWIAYFSDATGEYELSIMQSDGMGKTIQLTNKETGPHKFRYNPTWSPDSKSIVFTDKGGSTYIVKLGEPDAAGGFGNVSTALVDTDPWGNPFGVSWSHDGKWLAYAKQEERNGGGAIWLYNVAKGEKTKVTGGMFDDSAPIFDRKGDYLFFASKRSFNPTYSDLDTTFVYRGSQVLLAVPLRADVPSPWAPKSDEEDWRKLGKSDKKDADKAGDKKDDAKGGDKPGSKEGSKDAAKDDIVSGTWDGTATGPEPLPPTGLPFTLTLSLAKDNKVTGTMSSALHTGAIQNGKYDPSTKTIMFDFAAGDALVSFTLKIDNGSLSGTAAVGDATYNLTAKRSNVGEGGAGGDDKKEADADKKKDVVIDLEGLEARALQLPVPAGSFGRLAVNDKNQLLYARFPVGSGDEPGIKLFDLTDEKKEEKSVGSGSNFDISPDGKKILIARGSSASIQDASAGATGKPVITAGMTTTINPRDEWKQIFNDAWRIERDFFYVENMHGVDWNALRTQYGKMIDDCASRDDVSFVISELISELNIGHAYYSGGDIESGPTVSTGMLGCDYELVKGENGAPDAYRIKKIFRGGAWDSDAKGPLSQPGVNIKEGDFLLAVNGVPLDTKQDPWTAFQGLANKVVTLTVNDKPSLERPIEPAKKADEPKADAKDKKADEPEKPKTTGLRDVVVQTLASEDSLRYRAWIESKRAYVAAKTDGKVGYIYVPNTGQDGQSDLFRQFYGQIGKEALIIDERWNGGGQIPTRFIELLNRPITNYWARREGPVNPWPPDSHQGPKCMLINGLAGSGGDMFPWLFKEGKIGKVIGTRTWGGLVGISGYPALVDGGSVTSPSFGFFKKDGTWGVEGHGVDPDIVIIDDPAKMQPDATGWIGDPQLDAAIAHIVDEVKQHPYTPPKRPADPDRKGMGLPERDR